MVRASSSYSLVPSSASSVPLSCKRTRIDTTTSNEPYDPQVGQRFPSKQLTIQVGSPRRPELQATRGVCRWGLKEQWCFVRGWLWPGRDLRGWSGGGGH